jgi:hypothetical protein
MESAAVMWRTIALQGCSGMGHRPSKASQIVPELAAPVASLGGDAAEELAAA